MYLNRSGSVDQIMTKENTKTNVNLGWGWGGGELMVVY